MDGSSMPNKWRDMRVSANNQTLRQDKGRNYTERGGANPAGTLEQVLTITNFTFSIEWVKIADLLGDFNRTDWIPAADRFKEFRVVQNPANRRPSSSMVPGSEVVHQPFETRHARRHILQAVGFGAAWEMGILSLMKARSGF
jgi:hypothetical protein